jgi:hypothetical protein
MNITTDIRISVSASFNRAAEIVAHLGEEKLRGKNWEGIAEMIDEQARPIFAKEQAFLKEIAEEMKPKYTPSPTQKIEPKFMSVAERKEKVAEEGLEINEE